MNATPTKLRSGDWGIRVEGDAQPGMVVEVRTKAGKSWQAAVGEVIWTGEGVSICTSVKSAALAANDNAPAGERKVTPAKLRDGSWGARVQGAAAVGDRLTVVSSGGKSWDVIVDRIVWTGEGVTLVATRSLDCAPRSARAPRARRGGCGCDCSDCAAGCRCEAHCNCRGGNIFDC